MSYLYINKYNFILEIHCISVSDQSKTFNRIIQENVDSIIKYVIKRKLESNKIQT